MLLCVHVFDSFEGLSMQCVAVSYQRINIFFFIIIHSSKCFVSLFIHRTNLDGMKSNEYSFQSILNGMKFGGPWLSVFFSFHNLFAS